MIIVELIATLFHFAVPHAIGKVRNVPAAVKDSDVVFYVALQVSECVIDVTLANGTFRCTLLLCLRLCVLSVFAGEVCKKAAFCAVLSPSENIELVLTISSNGTIEQASDEVHVLLGYTPSELVGQSITMLARDAYEVVQKQSKK